MFLTCRAEELGMGEKGNLPSNTFTGSRPSAGPEAAAWPTPAAEHGVHRQSSAPEASTAPQQRPNLTAESPGGFDTRPPVAPTTQGHAPLSPPGFFAAGVSNDDPDDDKPR